MPDDDRDKPGVFASDDERALEGKRWQTPARGVPIHVPDPEDFTPVGHVIDTLQQQIALTERERQIVGLVLKVSWNHSANQELRAQARHDTLDGGKLREEVDRIDTAITDIRGEKGDNGKLGELRRRVDSLTSLARSIVMLAVGGIGAAAIKLVMVTRAFDAVEAKATHAQDSIADLRNHNATLQSQVLTIQTALLTRRHRPAVEPGNGSGQ